MKAYAIDEFGTTGSVRELPDPSPGEGDVRVRVAAASVNPFDSAVINGYVKDYLEHRFPLVPGGDLAGVIDEVGAGVEGLKVGDRVFGTVGRSYQGGGSMAELALAAASGLALTPAVLSDAQASTLPVAGVSGLMMVEAAELAAGDTVVVVGASGGVGGFAVQVAAARGAHVVAVTTAANADYVRGLGAAEVIDRGTGDVLEQLKQAYPDGVAALLDTASDAEGLSHLAGAVRAAGRVLSMKRSADADALAARGLVGANVSAVINAERLSELAALITEGKLVAPRVQEYPLAQAAEALAAVSGSHGAGKLVVVIE